MMTSLHTSSKSKPVAHYRECLKTLEWSIGLSVTDISVCAFQDLDHAACSDEQIETIDLDATEEDMESITITAVEATSQPLETQ